MNNPLTPLLDTLGRPMDIAGRVLLGLYFLIPGLSKVTRFSGTLAYMEKRGVPLALPLLLLTIPLQVGAGLLLLAARRPGARTEAAEA